MSGTLWNMSMNEGVDDRIGLASIVEGLFAPRASVRLRMATSCTLFGSPVGAVDFVLVREPTPHLLALRRCLRVSDAMAVSMAQDGEVVERQQEAVKRLAYEWPAMEDKENAEMAELRMLIYEITTQLLLHKSAEMEPLLADMVSSALDTLDAKRQQELHFRVVGVTFAPAGKKRGRS